MFRWIHEYFKRFNKSWSSRDHCQLSSFQTKTRNVGNFSLKKTCRVLNVRDLWHTNKLPGGLYNSNSDSDVQSVVLLMVEKTFFAGNPEI